VALDAFKKFNAPDRLMNTLQDNVDNSLRPLLTNPRNDGHLIENIVITSGTAKTVNHGLGRILRGWEIADKNANANVWKSTSSFPDKTLILNASANVTVSIYVY
jgi:hypothetical protein